MARAMCVECGCEFERSTSVATCSELCAKLHKRALKAEASKLYRQRRETATRNPIKCSECPNRFVPKKPIDATCSPKCSKRRARRLENARRRKLGRTCREGVAVGVMPHSIDWTPPRPGLPCGMDPRDEAYANQSLRGERV